MMICGQLHSCEFKFGSVVNLWSVEQIASKKKIEIAKLVLGFFFFERVRGSFVIISDPEEIFLQVVRWWGEKAQKKVPRWVLVGSCPGLLPEYIRVGTLTHIEDDLALQSKHICTGMKFLQHFVISIFELSKVYPVNLKLLRFSCIQQSRTIERGE